MTNTISLLLRVAWFPPALLILFAFVLPGAQAGPRTPMDSDLVELHRRVEHPRPEKRRSAVRALAEHGGRRAWEAVVGALEDPEGLVADAAQLALGELDDPHILSLLLGRGGLGHKQAWVRLRVAEALGRMPGPIPAKRLGARLSPRDPATSDALLWSIERLHGRSALEGNLGSLARKVGGCMGRNAPAGLRARALWTAARLAPDSCGQMLAEGLVDRAGEVRLAALFALEGASRGKDPGPLLEAATRAAADSLSGVRVGAVGVLERLGTPGALLVLTERLEVELRASVQARVLSTLQRATGLRYRLDPRPWRDRLRALPSGQRVVPVVGTKEKRAGSRASAPKRFPVSSDRAAYLVDLSGSTWNQRSDGRTRKELIDAMLQATLEGMPSGSYFNVVAYTGKPYLWQSELTKATPRSVRSAAKFFSKLRVTGPGDVWSAIQAVLGDPELDTIVLITDGAPTGGQRDDLDLMLALLLEATRWRPVRFDVVLVDSPGHLVRRWRGLAEATGGTCLELRFESKEVPE